MSCTGSYGRVYRGMYQGQKVAVKVRRNAASCATHCSCSAMGSQRGSMLSHLIVVGMLCEGRVVKPCCCRW